MHNRFHFACLSAALIACDDSAFIELDSSVSDAMPDAPITEEPENVPEGAIDVLLDYVNGEDESYAYERVRTEARNGYTLHVLNMDSLSWRSPEELSPNTWNHWVYILVPDEPVSDEAILLVFGGSQSPTEDSSGLSLFEPVVRETGAVVVGVSQVPGQPITAVDRDTPLMEDALVAYSWRKMMDTGDPTWSVYLPMTKALVRTMDTASDYLAGVRRAPSGYIVTGFSKRGAASWLTAAVDSRVTAVVPGVINFLDIASQAEDQFESYGQYADAAVDYVRENVLQELRSPEGRALRAVVDPLGYAERLTMPHYLLQATGDEFFMPDASRSFVSRIPGEVNQRIVPNEGHSLEAQLQGNLLGLIAWYETILADAPRPHLEERLSGGVLELETDQAASSVLLWTATNPDIRDFRITTLGAAWSSVAIQADEDGVFRVPLSTPAQGWTAHVVEFVYPGVELFPQSYTSSVYVTPDTRPFTLGREPGELRTEGQWRAHVASADPAELTQLLPFEALGMRFDSVDALGPALAGGNEERDTLAACVAARLNVQAGEASWYMPLSPTLNFWRVFAFAESEFAASRFGFAGNACRWLAQP